ncbi:MAG: hypothetical protein ACOCQP_03250, partial [Lentisphaeria bacterium]
MRKITMSCLFTLIAAMSVLPLVENAGAAKRDDKARDVWLSGYTDIKDAQDTENKARALELYKSADESFQKLHDQYPDWKTSMVKYRLEFLEGRIEELESSLAADDTEMSKEELVTKFNQQKKELKELREKADELEDLKGAKEEYESLKNDYDKL